MILFRFLYRHLKGLRLLVTLAIFVTISQVACDIITAFPLKFIPAKVSNVGADPACTFPFLNPVLDLFDIPQLDPSLIDPTTHQVVPPPDTQCPIPLTDAAAAAHPVLTHHTVQGVIVFSVILLIVFGMLSASLAYLDLYLAAYIAQNLSAKLRNHLFEHLQRLSLDWHGKQKKGDLVQRVTGNIADIEKLVTDGLVDLLASVLTLLGVALVMLVINVSYTIISLTVAPVLFVLVLTYTRGIKAAARKAAKSAGQVADVATEDINALTVIKVFTREEREAMRFGGYVDKNRQAGLRASGLQAQFVPIANVLLIMGTAVVVGTGGFVAFGTTLSVGPFSIAAQSVDIGTLVMFLIFLKLLYQPMRDLSKLTNLASTAASGAERIQEVLDQAPEVVESLAPYYGPQKLKGDIFFENVFFGYTPQQPVLKGINLHIQAGKKIGLVGTSGSGKTTLVKLIPRFYEISYGALKLDGVDSRLYPLNVLRNNVSMVLQDSVLFEGSIFDNISIGKPGAAFEEVVEAAKKADIHKAIVMQLGGYSRQVREQGKDLSGGQRQRIAIARAILRDAPILILDEPTASLDVESETEVMHALDKLIVGRTVLTISHRLSTLGHVDEIIVLKDGQLAERGSFKELKRAGGVFARLLDEQNRYNVEKASDQSIIRSAFGQNTVKKYELRQVVPVGQGTIPVPVPVIAGSASSPSNNLEPQEMQPPSAHIRVELEGKIVSERVLDQAELTIGRLSSNDIQIPNQRVSRRHARIHAENGAWIIEDVESVNGIVYRGKRIDKLALMDGDDIYVAPGAVLHYRISE